MRLYPVLGRNFTGGGRLVAQVMLLTV